MTKKSKYYKLPWWWYLFGVIFTIGIVALFITFVLYSQSRYKITKNEVEVDEIELSVTKQELDNKYPHIKNAPCIKISNDEEAICTHWGVYLKTQDITIDWLEENCECVDYNQIKEKVSKSTWESYKYEFDKGVGLTYNNKKIVSLIDNNIFVLQGDCIRYKYGEYEVIKK